jgi:predicted Holliday junction resolvase-like endonuclease
MEVLFYSLGVLTVAFLYTVVSVFKLNKKVDSLEDSVESEKKQMSIELNEIYREMDVRINHHATQPIREINENIAHEIEYLQRTIDSRVDKLENKLTNS